jgi:hypothetical protein
MSRTVLGARARGAWCWTLPIGVTLVLASAWEAQADSHKEVSKDGLTTTEVWTIGKNTYTKTVTKDKDGAETDRELKADQPTDTPEKGDGTSWEVKGKKNAKGKWRWTYIRHEKKCGKTTTTKYVQDDAGKWTKDDKAMNAGPDAPTPGAGFPFPWASDWAK